MRVLVLVHSSFPFLNPLRQQLAHGLSVANGFLIESPQVVYLFVEVTLELYGQHTDLHHFPFSLCHLTAGTTESTVLIL